jgi:hypothetical protein
MRIYIIGNDGITLCRKAPATVNDGEIAVASNEELHAASLSVRAGDPARDPEGKVLYPSITAEGFQKLATYQDIRAFARQTQQMNLVIYGAVTAYVLPIAYALLGAYAFGLRIMAAQTGTKTYQPSYSNRARLVSRSSLGPW